MMWQMPNMTPSVHDAEMARQEAILGKQGGWLRLLGEFTIALLGVLALCVGMLYSLATR